MRLIIIILFIIITISIGYGFYIKSSDPETGDVVIGLSILTGTFILMPLFIYHRWKNRKVKDYMLTKENIEKMKDFQKDKNI
jgi:membrane protein YdbS with pleckstrin-like domain